VFVGSVESGTQVQAQSGAGWMRQVYHSGMQDDSLYRHSGAISVAAEIYIIIRHYNLSQTYIIRLRLLILVAPLGLIISRNGNRKALINTFMLIRNAII
jgi:hypothetical protein